MSAAIGELIPVFLIIMIGWAARVTPDGQFLLPGVPPGTHTVVAWHKSAGYFRKTVHVTDAAGARIQFHIPLEEEAVAQAK